MSVSRKFEDAGNTAIHDLLFNLVLSLAFLLFVVLTVVNPPTKHGDVVKKAEYLIMMEWDHSSRDDIDMWVAVPPKQISVSYRHKEEGLIFLDRDDLGLENDMQSDERGNIVEVKVNREVLTMRGVVPGWYSVNAHYYTKRDKPPVTVTVSLIQLNPYKEWRKERITMTYEMEEVTMFNFRIEQDGKVTNINRNPVNQFRPLH